MYKYEIDLTRTVSATEQTQDAGWTDRWMDRTKPIYPPTTSLYGGIIMRHMHITPELLLPGDIILLGTQNSLGTLSTLVQIMAWCHQTSHYQGSPVLEIPIGPSVWGRQLWRRTGNFLMIFLQFYVYDWRSKPWGPTTFYFFDWGSLHHILEWCTTF